ncbi:DUF7313 family protein [Salinilacihabitans rarus]|uniref:DUF7313 family protein n=1 Tax=Salinilacihabitans rarus TaxID=2961596 RepID=UPI0020C8EBC3|nr:hypothetical protein [Salinilacihabitans rarus]
MVEPALFGPVDVLGTELVGDVVLIEVILLVLVVANLLVRAVAYRGYVATAREEGADAVSRSLPLEATTFLIVLGGFYYITVHLHGGVVFTTLALGVFVADFFEFEARLVEARTDKPFERPKGAITLSMLAFLYIAYQSLFFLVRPLWETVV